MVLRAWRPCATAPDRRKLPHVDFEVLYHLPFEHYLGESSTRLRVGFPNLAHRGRKLFTRHSFPYRYLWSTV